MDSAGVSDEWLRGLPKAEIHVHLEGSLDPGLVAAAARQARTEVPRPTGISTLPELLRYLDLACRVVVHPEQLAELAHAFATREHRSGARYADLIVNPTHWPAWEGRLEDLVLALDRGFSAAERDGLTPVGLCVSLLRTQSPAEVKGVVRRLVALAHPRVVGLSIDGNEAAAGRTADRFTEAFALAADGGLRRTAHAGESSGPEGVLDAIDLLGAERIDHGVRAVEAPELVAELAARRIPLNICPTSNVVLGVVPSMAEHPLEVLRRAGVRVSINTDDPTVLGTDLVGEYRQCVRTFGWDEPTLVAVARTSIEASFAPDSLKDHLLSDLNGYAIPRNRYR